MKFKRIKECIGKTAAVFKLRGSIFSSKKSPIDPIALQDPSSGILVLTPKEIMKVSLEYCVSLLTNREPKPEFVNQYNYKIFLHELRMKEKIPNDLDELTPEIFQTAINVITSKPGDKYNLLVKGGHSLFNALYQFSFWRGNTNIYQ